MNPEFRPGRRAYDEYAEHLEVHADVCIVGAGAGGSAAAAAMSQAGLKVAVFEEGRHWKPRDFKANTAHAFRNLYQAGGSRSLRGNAVIPMPGGKGVGGSTLINSAIAFRCPDEVMRQWRDDHGVHTVTQQRFDRYFDRIWRTIGVTVNPVQVQRNNNLIFKQGAEALGLQGSFMNRAAPGCAGCGLCQYGCPTGGKSTVDRSFLQEAIDTGRTAVYADCRMRGVESSGDQIRAITGRTMDPETLEPAGTVRVTADVFLLSGGPIGSPLFLLGNGLADDVHCGQHLVVHPTIPSLARFPQKIVPWSGVTQGYYVDCWDEGFLLQTYTVTPDQYYLTLQTRQGPDTMAVMKDLVHMASAGVLCHDEDSHGSVRHTPAGPDLYYHLGDEDRRRLILGTRRVAEVFFAAGATRVHPGRIGLEAVERPADIEASLPLDIPPTHLILYASHPMGTCRMGGDPHQSVVDPEGRVHGWANLRVADASVFPTSLGVNPQVTTMAMGLMVGESIAGV